MGKSLLYSVVSQFAWIFGVISACSNSDCINTGELTCTWEKLCNKGKCYRTTNSLIIDTQMGRSFKDCPQGFDNYKGYCLRVDLERKSWQEAYEDSDNGELAILYRKQDAEISAEYLRMKLPDSNDGVWTSGTVTVNKGVTGLEWLPIKAPVNWYGENINASYSKFQKETCLALRPNDYTTWDMINCGTMKYSLRIAYFVTGNNFTCLCKPGYGGTTCDRKAHRFEARYKMQDQISFKCSENTSIFIEFAAYEYEQKVNNNILDCVAPNALAWLRYLCQGKNNCTLEQSVLKSYLRLPCDDNDFLLAIQYLCLSKNEATCPNGIIQIEDEESTNCAFVSHQHVSWNETMKFCQTHGGQLAAFKNTTNLEKFSSNTGVPTSFWISSQLSNTIRPKYSTAAECTVAILDSQTKPIHVKVITDCSRNLTGICVFPPIHLNDNRNYSALLQPNLERTRGTMEDTTLIKIFVTTTNTTRDITTEIMKARVDTTTTTGAYTILPTKEDTTVQDKTDISFSNATEPARHLKLQAVSDPSYNVTPERTMHIQMYSPMDKTTNNAVDNMRDTMVDNNPKHTTASPKNCSSKNYGGLTWPSTIHGSMVQQPCPARQTGNATWTCENNGEFDPVGPDFSQCITSVSQEIADLLNNLNETTNPAAAVTGLAVTLEMAETMASGDIVNAVDLLDKAVIVQQQIMKNMTNAEKEYTMETFTSGVVNTTGAVLDLKNLTPWLGLNTTERAIMVTKLLADVDSTAMLYASTFTAVQKIPLKYNETLHLFIETRSNTDHSELQIANIIIPSEAFGLANKSESGVISIVTSTYSTIGQFMPIDDHFLYLKNITQVVSATLNKPIKMDHSNVTVTIENPFGSSKVNQSVCVFWNKSLSKWSSDGYVLGDNTNDTHFMCKCNHMTSFAVLMSFNPDEVNILALDLITIIGCGISIICLAACIITFVLVRTLRKLCYKVHLNLCISLMIANITLLMAHFYKKFCTALAMLLHYFYLATFMWMCMEGVQIYIYIALVRVFVPRRQRTYFYYMIGYGIPGLVVGISAGVKIKDYGSAKHCFLNAKSGLMWGFVGFVMVTLMFNAVLFLKLSFATLQNYTRNMQEAALADSAKQWMRQLIILHPLLGFTWIFGLLQYGDQLVFSYIFTILTSLQGMSIFMFHFFQYGTVREYFIKKVAFCFANIAKSSYSPQNPTLHSNGHANKPEKEYFALHQIKLLRYRTTGEDEYSNVHITDYTCRS